MSHLFTNSSSFATILVSCCMRAGISSRPFNNGYSPTTFDITSKYIPDQVQIVFPTFSVGFLVLFQFFFHIVKILLSRVLSFSV